MSEHRKESPGRITGDEAAVAAEDIKQAIRLLLDPLDELCGVRYYSDSTSVSPVGLGAAVLDDIGAAAARLNSAMDGLRFGIARNPDDQAGGA